VRFLEAKKELEDENEKTILAELVESVKSLQDKGVRAIEMAILVRNKKDARLIADLFLEQKSHPENRNYNFDILSGESLYINNSEVISLIISILTAFLNPDDQVVKAQVNYLYYRKIFPRLKGVQSKETEDGSPSAKADGKEYRICDESPDYPLPLAEANGHIENKYIYHDKNNSKTPVTAGFNCICSSIRSAKCTNKNRH
jgi:superfamily I DNA/RNA helicase